MLLIGVDISEAESILSLN